MPSAKRFPLAEFIGFETEITGPGHATATAEAGDHQLNPNGVVHGGVLFTMVDTAMGAAAASELADGETCASTDVHIRFLRSVTAGVLRAEAEVTHRGRRAIQLEARVRDGADRVVATATGSFAVLA